MRSKLFCLLFLIPFLALAQINRAKRDSLRNALRENFFYEKKEKVGIKNDRGKKITRPIFDDAEFLTKELFLVRKDTLNGVLDKYGKIVIPIKYKTISSYIGAVTKTENFSVTDFKGITSLYNKQGKVVFPSMIYAFNGYFSIDDERDNLVVLKKFKDTINKTYNNFTNKIFQFTDDGVKIVEILGYENIDIYNIDLNFESLQNNYISFRDFARTNKSVIPFTNSDRLIGLFNIDTQKVIPTQYTDMVYDKFANRILLRKGKYYTLSMDINLENEKKVEENIFRMSLDNFYVKEADKVYIKRNGIRSSFSYPKIEPYYDETRFVYHPISSSKLDFYRNVFKYYESLESEKFGIIDFNGKIYTPAIYDAIQIQLYDKYDNSELTNREQFYKDNKIDVVFLGVIENKDGSKKADFINSENKVMVSLDIPKNIFFADSFNLKNFTERGNLFSGASTKEKKGNAGSIFYLFNFKTGKKLLETVNEPISEVFDVGYKTVFYDNKKRENIVKFYNLEMKKIGEMKFKNDWENNNYELIHNWPTFTFSNENKIGLKNFQEQVLIPAIYDEIKVVGNGFNIVKLNGKYGIINDKNSIFVPVEKDGVIFNNYSNNCFKDATTWKSFFCLDRDNNVITK